MKVIKISDEAYAQVCRVAASEGTYLADALDIVVFKGVGTDAKKNQTSKRERSAKPAANSGGAADKPASRTRKAAAAVEEHYLGGISLKRG